MNERIEIGNRNANNNPHDHSYILHVKKYCCCNSLILILSICLKGIGLLAFARHVWVCVLIIYITANNDRQYIYLIMGVYMLINVYNRSL